MDHNAFSNWEDVQSEEKTFSYARLLAGHSLIPVAETSSEGVAETNSEGVGEDAIGRKNVGVNNFSVVLRDIGLTITVKILCQIKYLFFITS